jgi:chemotaxis protein MotA
MFAILGILVVIGAIVGGYLMEHGNLLVLVQPAELVIIGGAAIGTILIGNPLSTILQLVKKLAEIFKPSAFSKSFYLEHIKLLYEIFQSSRKFGMVKLEEDIEEPAKSPLFQKYPRFAKNHHALHFVCDTLRMYVSGGVSAIELDQMMELDLDVHHAGVRAPVNALSTVADSLPGLGIVAAVLGVVITMGAIGGPPEEIGHKVAAALVGTFLGILLCYGFLGPMASSMAKGNENEAHFYHFLRVGLAAFIRGAAPILAVEFGRRAIPSEVRPTFKEMEDSCKKIGKEAAPAEQSAA